MEKQKGAVRLTAVNPPAADCGLAVGASLADARAVVPGLLVQDHDGAADEELLDRIADSCVRYTPMVAVDPPDGIILDIGGTVHLFGGEAQLTEALKAQLRAQGLTMRLACASTAEAAHALARYSVRGAADEADAIHRLPVAALELKAEDDLGLRRAGLHTIGDVAGRPRSAIAARFGAKTVFALERLIGTAEKPLNPRVIETPLMLERRFAEPIANKNYALKVLHELLEEAKIKLAQDHLGGRCFEASFYRVDGRVQSLSVETGLPTRDTKAITRLFDERLDGLSDRLDPGFGFDSVRLSVPRTDLLKPLQTHLEKEAVEENSTAEFLDQLVVRLGRNRLLRFRPNDTHIPERSQRAVFAIDSNTHIVWPRAKAGEPPSRPLQLFDPPQRIAVIAEIPDGPPKRFRWRGKVRDISRHEGPERIASEWWRSDNDPLGQHDRTRDYYRIEDITGRRYWVFRHGLYGREADDPNWYLHGLFA